MTTLKIIEGQIAEYKEKFKCIQGDCDGTGHIPEQVSEDEHRKIVHITTL